MLMAVALKICVTFKVYMQHTIYLKIFLLLTYTYMYIPDQHICTAEAAYVMFYDTKTKDSPVFYIKYTFIFKYSSLQL